MINANDKTYFNDGPMKGKYLRDFYLEGVKVIYGDFPGHYEHVHLMEWVEDNREHKIVRKLRYVADAALAV